MIMTGIFILFSPVEYPNRVNVIIESMTVAAVMALLGAGIVYGIRRWQARDRLG